MPLNATLFIYFLFSNSDFLSVFENMQRNKKRKIKNTFCVRLWHDSLTNTVILYLKYVWSYDELSPLSPPFNKKEKTIVKKLQCRNGICSVCLCLVSVHAVILSRCVVVTNGGAVLGRGQSSRPAHICCKTFFVHLLINCDGEVVNYFFSSPFFYFT